MTDTERVTLLKEALVQIMTLGEKRWTGVQAVLNGIQKIATDALESVKRE